MLKWDDFDFGVHRSHVDQLSDPDSWNASVVRDGRKPRVFIDAHVNQSENVEIRSIGGRYKIYFDDDFTWAFLNEATVGHYGPHRSVGEIMWMRNFSYVRYLAIHQKSSVAKALLFGFKARLDELIREISAHMNVVGAMELQFRFQGKNVDGVAFVPNISNDQIRELQEQSHG
jgi:hypothetical protein